MSIIDKINAFDSYDPKKLKKTDKSAIKMGLLFVRTFPV